VSQKTKLGRIRVAAGLGKPAAGDADMGDVASQLTSQSSNFTEKTEDLSPISGYRAKCGYFLGLLTKVFLGTIIMAYVKKR
jgi:hypothetical protein